MINLLYFSAMFFSVAVVLFGVAVSVYLPLYEAELICLITGAIAGRFFVFALQFDRIRRKYGRHS